MNKVCAVVLLTVAACGGTTKKTDIGGKLAASDDVTAALFEQGKSWTFALATKTTPPVDTGAPTTVANGNLTCTIDSVRTVGAASVAKMSCAGAIDSAPTMYWVRNSQGLWGYYAGIEAAELAKQLANPNPKEMLLAATPAAHETEIKDAEGANALYWAKPGDAGAWCTGYTYAMGDEYGWEICLKAGVGIVSGNWFDAGATTTEHIYAVAGAVGGSAASGTQKIASSADCAGAIASAMKVVEASLSKMQLEPKVLQITRAAMGTMSVTLTNVCIDDKWSLATTDCMQAAKDEPSGEACKYKMTTDQLRSMSDKMADASKQMQEDIMKAMQPADH